MSDLKSEISMAVSVENKLINMYEKKISSLCDIIRLGVKELLSPH